MVQETRLVLHVPSSSRAGKRCYYLLLLVSMVQGAYISPGHTQLAELAQQQANDIAFDPSAISILDEAVTLGVLPAFKYVSCVPAATRQPSDLPSNQLSAFFFFVSAVLLLLLCACCGLPSPLFSLLVCLLFLFLSFPPLLGFGPPSHLLSVVLPLFIFLHLFLIVSSCLSPGISCVLLACLINLKSCCDFCNSCCTAKEQALLHSTNSTSFSCQLFQMVHHLLFIPSFPAGTPPTFMPNFPKRILHCAIHIASPVLLTLRLFFPPRPRAENLSTPKGLTFSPRQRASHFLSCFCVQVGRSMCGGHAADASFSCQTFPHTLCIVQLKWQAQCSSPSPSR